MSSVTAATAWLRSSSCGRFPLGAARPRVAAAQKAAQVVEGALKDAELEWESPEPGNYVVK
ncbi:hypothetical protein ABZ821_33665, partial [Streptomyces rochei]